MYHAGLPVPAAGPATLLDRIRGPCLYAMPFTLSHPALILPLHASARRLTSLPALVIGSMMPDLPYFLITGASGDFSHTLVGILAYCVPMGALIYMLYYALIRDALLEWAPQAIAARMRPQAQWTLQDTRTTAVVLASLAIGAASHLAWDAFTHGNTLVSNHVQLLRTPVTLGARPVPLFKLLQHLSGLAGLVVIAGYLVRWFVRTEPLPIARRRPGNGQRLFVLAAVALAGAGGGLAGGLLRQAGNTEHLLFNIVVSALAAAALTVVALCAGWRYSLNRRMSRRMNGRAGQG